MFFTNKFMTDQEKEKFKKDIDYSVKGEDSDEIFKALCQNQKLDMGYLIHINELKTDMCKGQGIAPIKLSADDYITLGGMPIDDMRKTLAMILATKIL